MNRTAESQPKARLLTLGAAMASERGLAGLTFGALASAAGVSKSGLFAHFPSKEALQVELLDRAALDFRDHVIAAGREAAAGLPRLAAIFQAWLDWTAASGWAGGCPFVAAAAEFDDIAGPVRDHLVAQQQSWLEALERYVADAIGRGHLPADTDAEQLAWEIQGAYLIHHFTKRLLDDVRAGERARTAFARLTDNPPRRDR
ncbi:MAG: TetR/AcrR family transcriptional regulator [Alphaproteobacteria bacterium]